MPYIYMYVDRRFCINICFHKMFLLLSAFVDEDLRLLGHTRYAVEHVACNISLLQIYIEDIALQA